MCPHSSPSEHAIDSPPRVPSGFAPIDDPKPDRLGVVFLGAGAFGVPTLLALAEQHDVLAVVTQPDRPAGRGRRLTPTDIASAADEHLPKVPVYKCQDVNDPAMIETLHAIPSHAWVVIAFGQKLSEPLIAGRNAMNLHGSRLPRWRGAAPVHHAILSGDDVCGNTVITIAPRMDAGLILGMSSRPISDAQTTGELHDALSSDGPELILSVLDRLKDRTLTAQQQDEARVTRARKLSAEDREVNWERSACMVARQINGLSPWPGARSALNGAPLKLVRASAITPVQSTGEGLEPQAVSQPPSQVTTLPPGTIVDWDRGSVATSDGTVTLLEVQAPGKGVLPWSEYARGRAKPDLARFAATTPVAKA